MPAEVVDVRLDLSEPRAVHVVGVGGAGMSAIALVLAQMGHQVSGSDLRASRALDRVALAGVTTYVGHDAEHLADRLDAVIVSTAVRDDNVEVVAAARRGLPVLRRADALRSIVATRRGIGVAGSHGKTTTSSMLTLVLREAGWHPSFLIGGELNEVGTNASLDDGEWLVVEADESDGTFLELPIDAAIVTNVEPDHLDHYGGFEELVAAFGHFVDGVPGPVVVGADDVVARGLAEGRSRVASVGDHPSARYRTRGYAGARFGSRFVLHRDGEELGEVRLPVPGRHNARNAAAAAALAVELGVPWGAVVTGLGGFGGVARRFQFRGELEGVTLVDDYAHLPGEVASMVNAAREGGWRRVVVVFQPHRYSRTRRLWRDFADAFVGADSVVVTDVYAAGERPEPGVSGRLVADAARAAHPDLDVQYVPRRDDLLDLPSRLAGPGDVVLTLGAGDLTTLPDEWCARHREP